MITGQIKGPGGIIRVEASISLEGGPRRPAVGSGRHFARRDPARRPVQRVTAKSTALEKALEEIKSVEELKDEFLTTLSHELKTPLVSLKGFLQLLRQGKASE